MSIIYTAISSDSSLKCQAISRAGQATAHRILVYRLAHGRCHIFDVPVPPRAIFTRIFHVYDDAHAVHVRARQGFHYISFIIPQIAQSYSFSSRHHYKFQLIMHDDFSDIK